MNRSPCSATGGHDLGEGLSVLGDPPGLDEKYWHHVRGAQVQLWSEYIATREHLDYMAFPRTAAFAESSGETRSP